MRRCPSSYIGPYTTTGPGARIKGAEVVRSIGGEGAQISFHVNEDVDVVLD